MSLRIRMACLVVGLITGAGQTQTAPAVPSLGAVGSKAEPSKALDVMLTMFESQATGVVKAMPADKFTFAPSTGTFVAGQNAKFDGVRTFAQEATHLIDANYYFYGIVGGMKPEVDLKAINAMTNKAEIVSALASSFVFAHKALAQVTNANAFQVIPGADGVDTRATLAAFAVAHGFDHYGQMVEYLRMNGVVPPGSR